MSSGARTVRAPRGTELSCRGWQQKAVLRMIMNDLDSEVAERPDDLVASGGSGRAARPWDLGMDAVRHVVAGYERAVARGRGLAIRMDE